MHKHIYACVFVDSGKLYTFGDGANGQLGHGTSLLSCDKPELVMFNKKSVKVKKSSCGESHTAVITGMMSHRSTCVHQCFKIN